MIMSRRPLFLLYKLILTSTIIMGVSLRCAFTNLNLATTQADYSLDRIPRIRIPMTNYCDWVRSISQDEMY